MRRLLYALAIFATSSLLLAPQAQDVTATGTITDDDTSGGSAENWETRIADPDVVWYHAFTNEDEVNNFRWTAGEGVDPDANGSSLAAGTSWVSTGGPDGNGYMQILRPGTDTGGDGLSEPSDWIRPFSPITGSGNGRGSDDPGANGTLTPQTWNPNSTSQLATWMGGSNPGWYAHSSYAASYVDGTDFYIQMRVMADPRSSQMDDNGGTNVLTGKFAILAATAGSNVDQTHVILQRTVDPNATGVGEPNYHDAYVYQDGNATNWGQASLVPNPASDYEAQPGRTNAGACQPRNSGGVSGCWSYALDGTWDTLMYHVQPGIHDNDDTQMTVYAAHYGEQEYTVISDFTYNGQFEQGVDNFSQSYRNGFNALYLMGYNNGFTGISYPTFWTRFSSVIFSKGFINPPGGCSSPANTMQEVACGMSSGDWEQLSGADEPTGLDLFANQSGASGMITGYGTIMAYDPNGDRLFWIASDHGDGSPGGNDDAVFLIFDFATNTWSTQSVVPWASTGVQHGYNHITYDYVNDELYYTPLGVSQLRQWDGGGTWGTISFLSDLAYTAPAKGTAFFPELGVDANSNGAIVVFQQENGNNGEVIGIDPVTSDTETYAEGETLDGVDNHTSAIYSAVHQIVLMAAGNGGNNLWRLEADGDVVQLDDSPAGVTIGTANNMSIAVPNPSNGNYIVCKNGSTWYDLKPMESTGNQWVTRSGTCDVLTEPTNLGQASWTTFGTVCTALDEDYNNTIVCVKAYGPTTDAVQWLFKP
jgi:hypothetical protein